MIAVNSDCSVSLCDRLAQSCCNRVSVSDGVLFNRLKSTQKIAETSLVSDFPFLALAHADHQKERVFVSCFSHHDSVFSYFACRPSPPYIARYVYRFRSRRLAKLCGCELHHKNKALQSKGRVLLCPPQERASGAYDSPIRYSRAENRAATYFLSKRGCQGVSPWRTLGTFLLWKVPRRRPAPATAQMVLTCRNATRNNLS